MAEAGTNGTAEEKEEAAAKKDEAAKKEQAAAEQEPAIPVPATNDMWLTVPKLGLYDNYVANSSAHSALDVGAAKLVESGFPWQEGYTNTYIAGHRVGWPGTGSYYQFYNLPAMREGDVVYLADANGMVYTYRVSEVFAVSPWENWVTASIAGRDVVTLQTCTESVDDWWTLGPNLFAGGPESGRLIVRADRVS